MILRHFDTTYTPERIRHLPRFDGCVWTQGHGLEQTVHELQSEGIKSWIYFNMWTLPPDEWTRPLPGFLGVVDQIVPPLTVQGESVESWHVGRKLWAWPLLDQGVISELSRVIRYICATHNSRVFLDLAFTKWQPWMSPGVEIPEQMNRYWERHVRKFLWLVSIDKLMCNGSRELNYPQYLEYANLNWDRDLGIWRGNTNHILSVDPADFDAVDMMVELHQEFPNRWFAFSGPNEDLIDLAYERLAR